ncbi:MAG: hypothetical protein JW839_10670 [Candidatus Lokiarchaeota archaeon]|nr:hypothetical protein [Candidatus Lokiarchaeota archaeon]
MNRRKLAGLLVAAIMLVPFYVAEHATMSNKFRSIRELPDPFAFNNGTRVATATDWEARRGEIKEILADIEYGHIPPPPDALNATVTGTRDLVAPDPPCTEFAYNITVVPSNATPDTHFSFRMMLYVPTGTGPFPCIARVGYGFMPTPILRGYAFCYFENLDLDADNDTAGPAERAYPGYDWGSLAIWAWGLMRVVDVLQAIPPIDAGKLVSTGHSRAGKVALFAAAYDERIAAAAPTQSGTGSVGSYLLYGPGSETLESMAVENFPYWYKRSFAAYAGREADLPFDQHFLKALVAPRYLVCIEARDYDWGNPEGNWATHLAALEVYKFLGVPGRLGITWRDGGHTFHDELENNAVCDFADLAFFGTPVSRDISSPPFPTCGTAGAYFHWQAPKAH